MKVHFAFGLVAAAAVAAACSTSKSSNPLSPTVAGPIPGVNITAPTTVTPSSGAKISVSQQPVTLTVQNASTNGVRPLNYTFDVAADSGFTSIVYTRDGITPGSGQTSVQLPEKLAPEKTYYWRARAQDGANTGPYSSGAIFNVYTPVVIQAPAPTAPINNATTTSAQPAFTWTNAQRSGPAGTIAYAIEVSDSGTFANKLPWTVAEQANQTSTTPPQALPYGKQLFWHVRAADPTTTGPWSATQVFQTPAQAATPPPAGGGGGPSAGDQINLNSATIYSSPADIGSWSVTESITSLQMSPTGGISMIFSPTLPNSWKWYTGSGGDNYQYTVWACVQLPQWACAGFVDMWQGRAMGDGSLPPILSQYVNWWGDPRHLWGAMSSYVPKAGDQVAFLISAGQARLTGGVTSVRERSNVVVVTLPAGDSGSFTFSAGAPIRLR